MSVIEAIETNDVSFYSGDYMNDKKLEALEILIAIYDELDKPEPNEEFLEQSVEQLKGYL